MAKTKTNEPRLVPLRKQSREALKEYLSWRKEQGEEITSDRPLILSHHTTRKGERLSYHGIYFAIEKIGELAEIPQLHPHSFRHTYSTELLLMGVDPTHARKLTGHRSRESFGALYPTRRTRGGDRCLLSCGWGRNGATRFRMRMLSFY